MNVTELLIPKPVHVAVLDGRAFTLGGATRISATGAAVPVAGHLASFLRRATGHELPLVSDFRPGDVALELTRTFDGGPEAYALTVTDAGARVRADTPAGLFNGIQTLRQLFDPAIEAPPDGPAGNTDRQRDWTVPAVEIKDAPRFRYRGLMLDVARSFFTVAEVKEQIDVMAQLKFNALHLHLTDDQAWRIEIHEPENNPSGLEYANLTAVGGAVNHPGVGLTPGRTGFYTQQDYRDIQAYAAARNITVVPEIDLPGHVNAALAAVPRLNPDGMAKPMNATGEVGYSTLDADIPATYEFVSEVLGQVAAITDGPYLHIGGDEAHVTGHENYLAMVREFARIGAATGKTVVGWNEAAEADLPDGSVVQYWFGDFGQVLNKAEQGTAKVIMSPADRTYLDQKYDSTSPIGLSWVDGGPFTWSQYYQWNPAQGGLEDQHILGVEGPLWTETVRGNRQAYWLLYPRAVSLAEVAWSPQEARSLGDFRRRLGGFGERLANQGVTFQPAADVEWSATPADPFTEPNNTTEYGTIEGMSEQNGAQWHDEPTDYGQIGKLPRKEAASAQDSTPPASVIGSLNITAAAADPELLDLPWHIALEDWPAEFLAALPRGISRHIVRFAHLGGSVIAIKETSEHVARHEYHMLRKLARLDVPCVEPVAVITGRTTADGKPLNPVLVTRHLKFSMPYRALFSQMLRKDTLTRLIDAQALLLVRLHLIGFYWGDVSLSNTLFRRDAGAFAAYLVDAETGELYPDLSMGQREYDLEIARVNIAGELMDLLDGGLIEEKVDPVATSELIMDSYRRLWAELTEKESFELGERWRVAARIRRLNELGFDVEEYAIKTTADGSTIQLQPKVVDAGHHQRRLLRLTGLDAQENQARRLLNDMDQFRADNNPELDEEISAHAWVSQIFEPIVRSIPRHLAGKLEPAEVVHEVLEHRWYMSQKQDRHIPLAETVQSYIDTVLRHRRDEAAIMLNPDTEMLKILEVEVEESGRYDEVEEYPDADD